MAADRRLKRKALPKILTTFLRFPVDSLERISVLVIQLPGCLSYAGNLTTISEFTEADTANSVLTEVGVRSTADLASVVSASRKLGSLLLLKYH